MTFDNAISWFEIPATDIDRAQKFYEAIFGIEMAKMDMDGYKMRMFPINDPMTGIGGALCEASEFHGPSDKGVLIYLNANPDIQAIIDRIESAGGQVIVPKTLIAPEYGTMAVFMDTEGNRIGLHSIEGVVM
ncbi:VOC family protein [Mucilaginibacter myungsuensis]|uniref:VOC family protein n=1 Tax=Mucilaginibacter myungsuensis TaxID=649104 RepID=A0A929PXR4_9SPHI|nr:VOC family protein [Mucilaginibacter myungsuensis]MBE9662542.1 VOC family protein [Mucilaginibacter myungsuensis]MDN3597961.1 VOC family protein [Mucilaginibacter myungsuensis]